MEQLNRFVSIDFNKVQLDIAKFGSIGADTEGITLKVANVLANKWQQILNEKGLNYKVNTYINGNSGYLSAGPHSGWMETGSPKRDLKETHPFGKQSRISNKGIPYLIVPFQHKQKNIPTELKSLKNNNLLSSGKISNVWKTLPRSTSTGYKKETASAFGMKNIFIKNGKINKSDALNMVQRKSYNWGGRIKISKQAIDILDKSRDNQKSSGIFNNMVAMEQTGSNGNETKQSKSRGGHGYATGMTFRIISANSPPNSWIVPEKKEIMSEVVPILQKEADDYMDKLLNSL